MQLGDVPVGGRASCGKCQVGDLNLSRHIFQNGEFRGKAFIKRDDIFTG